MAKAGGEDGRWVDRPRVATPNRCGYNSAEPSPMPMPKRQPISIRPTPAQRAWLDEQSSRRGLALNAVVILALEQAMAADQPQAQPDADR